MIYWLFLIPIFFFLLAIIGAAMQDKKEKERQAMSEYFKTDDKVGRAINSNSRKYVSETIKEYKSAYNNSMQYQDSSGHSLYMTEMAGLQSHLKGLEEDAWLRKAEKYLVSFADNYYMVTSGELNNFKDVELAMKAKNKCISSWQKYFAIDLTEYETTIYPKRYLKEWMGEDYDPCMESHETLEKKLSECIQELRPEYKRKKRLFEDIVEYVYTRPDTPRSDLLRVSFPGATQEEVRQCYRELVKKNRLFEMKMGNRYFVSLSDKELSKAKYKQNPIEKNVDTEHEKDSALVSGQITIDEIMTEKSEEDVEEELPSVQLFLKQRDAEFVDKTDKGGALYFFDAGIADELRQRGFQIQYANNGTKSTGGKAAWYIKATDLKRRAGHMEKNMEINEDVNRKDDAEQDNSLQNEWQAKWPPETHTSEYALKRIESAKSAKVTPSSIDREAHSAVFKGSGKTPYTTTLHSCTCVDFVRNKKPCKHMYRLAIELGLLGEEAANSVTSYTMPSGGLSWTEVADQVEQLPENVQQTFCELIRGMKRDQIVPMKKKKKDEIDKLIEAGIFVTEPSKETPKFYTITIVPDYTPEIYKVYQYFNRKFNPPKDVFMDENGDVYELYKPLANDDRTKRLLEKGFAVNTEEGTFIKGCIPE